MATVLLFSEFNAVNGMDPASRRLNSDALCGSDERLTYHNGLNRQYSSASSSESEGSGAAAESGSFYSKDVFRKTLNGCLAPLVSASRLGRVPQDLGRRVDKEGHTLLCTLLADGRDEHARLVYTVLQHHNVPTVVCSCQRTFVSRFLKAIASDPRTNVFTIG